MKLMRPQVQSAKVYYRMESAVQCNVTASQNHLSCPTTVYSVYSMKVDEHGSRVCSSVVLFVLNARLTLKMVMPRLFIEWTRFDSTYPETKKEIMKDYASKGEPHRVAQH